MNFIEKLKKVFKENNIEVIEFNGEKEKIVYKCLNCGKIYESSCARNLFSKITLCKQCYNPFSRWNVDRLMEYKFKRLYPNSDITIISYKGICAGTTIKCNKCGEIEEIKNLESLFNGRKDYFCNNCEKESDKIYNHMLEELDKGFVKLIEWNGVNNKSKFQCNRCGCIFDKKVSSSFSGKICPNCFKVYNKFSFDEANQWLEEKTNGEYTLLQYKGDNDKSLIKHNKCGFCYSTRLTDFEKTKGCPKCYRKNKKKQK